MTREDFEKLLGIPGAPKDGRWTRRENVDGLTMYYLGGIAVASWSKGNGQHFQQAMDRTPNKQQQDPDIIYPDPLAPTYEYRKAKKYFYVHRIDDGTRVSKPLKTEKDVSDLTDALNAGATVMKRLGMSDRSKSMRIDGGKIISMDG